jgi:large subunit ribosomal protein L23
VVDKAISPYTVIVRPVITEKSTDLAAANKYIFEVDIRANKPQIKQAIETAFEVTVVEVNTMVMKGKPRGNQRFCRKVTYGSDWKKAIVTLAADDKIELFEGV